MQLPLLTENEDLVEVFEIIGHVELAETPLGGTRSKGTVLSSSRRPGRSKPPARCIIHIRRQSRRLADIMRFSDH